MNTRLMAGAFLMHGDKVLLMQRSVSKKLNPGLWAPIGGHLEPDEVNNPAAACLREIREETGITPELICDFRLKYMIARNNGGLIYVNYIFFGRLEKQPELMPCDEGTLHFVDFSALEDYPMSFSITQAVSHFKRDPENESAFLGAVNPGNTAVIWCEL